MSSARIGSGNLLEVLKQCGNARDLARGKLVHAAATDRRELSSVREWNSLISMYGKCGSVIDARLVFDRMPAHSVVSWNALLLGIADAGDVVLELFAAMREKKVPPDRFTYMALLRACGDLAAKEKESFLMVKLAALEKTMEIHAMARRDDDRLHNFVENGLIEAYAKCGSLIDARMVFDRMELYSVVSWTSLIIGYAEIGDENIALEIFSRMEETAADSRTFVAAIKACSALAAREQGRQVDGKMVKVSALDKGRGIHDRAAKLRYNGDIFLASSLVNFYCKCGSLDLASNVFEAMPDRNLVAANALMLGYADNREGDKALEIFAGVKHRCGKDDYLAFVAAAKACSCLATREIGSYVDGKLLKVGSLAKAMLVHTEAARCGCDNVGFVRNSMIDMYSKCGSLIDARRLFETASLEDVVSWNALISGYVENGEPETGLSLFDRMSLGFCSPDARTFVAVVKAIAALAEREDCCEKTILKKAMEIHSQIVERGCDSDLFVATTMIDMYAKCRSLKDAEKVFEEMKNRDAVAWTTMLLAFVEDHEHKHLGLGVFERMQREGCRPIALTYVAALKACSSLAMDEVGEKMVKTVSLKQGAAILSKAEEQGFDSDVAVMNAAVEMFAACGSMADAERAFDRMPIRSLASWNAMMIGYLENGDAAKALDLLSRLQRDGSAVPNAGTFIAAIKASANLVDLQSARQQHREICRCGLESHEIVANSLVDVYGKCGTMIRAHRVFDSISRPDLVSWNALLAGYSRQGDIDLVFSQFQAMEDEGIVKADVVTFVCLLAACSHAGLVDRGKRVFQVMVSRYGINPVLEHYHCLVDSLGRGNQLDEAMKIVEAMPFSPNGVTWRTVLGASVKWSNDRIAKTAFECALAGADPREL